MMIKCVRSAKFVAIRTRNIASLHWSGVISWFPY